MYRTMWLAKPDVNMILRAKCASAGLRSHKLLADRLRIMMDLSHRQIIRNIQKIDDFDPNLPNF